MCAKFDISHTLNFRLEESLRWSTSVNTVHAYFAVFKDRHSIYSIYILYVLHKMYTSTLEIFPHNWSEITYSGLELFMLIGCFEIAKNKSE